MNEPLVCAVMLTRDRPKLAKGAVECFRAQTYPAKELLIWDTSHEVDSYQSRIDRVAQVFADKAPRTIGALRKFRTCAGPASLKEVHGHRIVARAV